MKFGEGPLPPLEPGSDLLAFAQEVRRVTVALEQVGYSRSEAFQMTVTVLPPMIQRGQG